MEIIGMNILSAPEIVFESWVYNRVVASLSGVRGKCCRIWVGIFEKKGL